MASWRRQRQNVFDVDDIKVFDCEERQVPWYYGIGYNGRLTADIDCGTKVI